MKLTLDQSLPSPALGDAPLVRWQLTWRPMQRLPRISGMDDLLERSEAVGGDDVLRILLYIISISG